MRRKPNRESGFAMLIVFLMAAVIAISLYMELPRVAMESQRQKEQLLIERGEQYKRAIKVFFKTNNRWPAKIEDLENMNGRRFLRKRYIDPMTGKDEWRAIHIANGVLTDSKVQKQGQGQGSKDSTAGQYITEQAGIGQTASTTGAANLARSRIRGSDSANPGGGGAPGFTGEYMGELPGQQPPGPQPPDGQQPPGTQGQPGQPGAVQPGAVPGVPGMPGVPGATGPNVPGQLAPGVPFPGQGRFPGANIPGATGVTGATGTTGPQAPNQNQGTGYITGGSYIGGGPPTPNVPGQPNRDISAQSDAARQMLEKALYGPRPGGPPNVVAGGMVGGAGIAGFASTADAEGVMIYNDRTNYGEWEYIYDPTKDRLFNPLGGNPGSENTGTANPATLDKRFSNPGGLPPPSPPR